MKTKRYYIRKTRLPSGDIEYKRYKCSDGFCRYKSMCWCFTKQGASKIIERLNREYHYAVCAGRVRFDLEECEE